MQAPISTSLHFQSILFFVKIIIAIPTFGPPPCIFRALTVATSTTTSGLRPDVRHLMLKNFSMPISAPKPASVTEPKEKTNNNKQFHFKNSKNNFLNIVVKLFKY